MQSLRYFDKVKTGKDTHPIIWNPECKYCCSENESGKSMRKAIDKYYITHNITDTLKYAKLYIKEPISAASLRTHLTKHSSYIEDVKQHIKDLAESTAMDKIDNLEERLDPDEVISEIITIGGQKVKTGELPVDRSLLLGALKEQGARRKFGTLREVLEGLDRVRFGELPVREGEILEDGATSEASEDIQG